MASAWDTAELEAWVLQVLAEQPEDDRRRCLDLVHAAAYSVAEIAQAEREDLEPSLFLSTWPEESRRLFMLAWAELRTGQAASVSSDGREPAAAPSADEAAPAPAAEPTAEEAAPAPAAEPTRNIRSRRRGPRGLPVSARDLAAAAHAPPPRRVRHRASLPTAGLLPTPPSPGILVSLGTGRGHKRSRAEAGNELVDECLSVVTCPITLRLTVQPVVAKDGHVYEKNAIEEWLKSKSTSPMCNKPMDPNLVRFVRGPSIIQGAIKRGLVDDKAASEWYIARAQAALSSSRDVTPSGQNSNVGPLQLELVKAWLKSASEHLDRLR